MNCRLQVGYTFLRRCCRSGLIRFEAGMCFSPFFSKSCFEMEGNGSELDQ